jgi:hypothetical protein
LKKYKNIPPNFFCIKKVETSNGAMIKKEEKEANEKKKDRKD